MPGGFHFPPLYKLIQVSDVGDDQQKRKKKANVSNLQVMKSKRSSGDAGMALVERKQWGETPKVREKYNPSMLVMTEKEKKERDWGRGERTKKKNLRLICRHF